MTIDQDTFSGTIASTSTAMGSGQAITNVASEATTIAGSTSSHRYQRRKYKKRSVYGKFERNVNNRGISFLFKKNFLQTHRQMMEGICRLLFQLFLVMLPAQALE